MNTPRVMFVDAPTAVGKDYFIDKFVEEYRQTFPDEFVSVVRATDVVLNSHTETENRKYTSYQTEDDKKNSIFIGHIRLLLHINELLQTSNLVIVNRSFLSFLIYNIYPAIRALSGNNDIPNFLVAQKEDMIETYIRLFRNLFTDVFVGSLFVRLSTDPALGSPIETILNRIDGRQDGKQIDRHWLAQILSDYDTVDDRYLAMFSYSERVTSSDYIYIISKYFS